jgi:hypothetical protein
VTDTCEVCGDDRANVEPVTLSPWPAGDINACPVCRYFYDTDDRDGCLTCGSEDPSNYVEVEANIGDVGFPGCITGALCEDCARHFAAEITQCRRNIPADVLVAAEPNLTHDDLEAANG